MSEKVQSNASSIKTVGELIEALKKEDPNKKVSLLIEFDGQWEDSLREIISTKDRIILMGLERICPEYEEINKK